MIRALYWYTFVRTGTITIVNGTSAYELGDDCLLPLSFWRQGQSPDSIKFISAEEVDRLGFRSTATWSAQGRAEQYTSSQGRFTASKTVVCSTISGVTLTRTSGDSFATADIGKRVRINGEAADYYIATITASPNACTLDRGYVARASGEATFAEVTTASTATVEISPGPIRKIEIVPTPATADTAYYRYSKRWKYLLANTDVPDALEEQWHWLWIIGAKLQIKAFLEKESMYAIYKGDFEQGISELRAQNMPTQDGPQARYEAVFAQSRWPAGGNVDLDVYRRGG